MHWKSAIRQTVDAMCLQGFDLSLSEMHDAASFAFIDAGYDRVLQLAIEGQMPKFFDAPLYIESAATRFGIDPVRFASCFPSPAPRSEAVTALHVVWAYCTTAEVQHVPFEFMHAVQCFRAQLFGEAVQPHHLTLWWSYCANEEDARAFVTAFQNAEADVFHERGEDYALFEESEDLSVTIGCDTMDAFISMLDEFVGVGEIYAEPVFTRLCESAGDALSASHVDLFLGEDWISELAYQRWQSEGRHSSPTTHPAVLPRPHVDAKDWVDKLGPLAAWPSDMLIEQAIAANAARARAEGLCLRGHVSLALLGGVLSVFHATPERLSRHQVREMVWWWVLPADDYHRWILAHGHGSDLGEALRDDERFMRDTDTGREDRTSLAVAIAGATTNYEHPVEDHAHLIHLECPSCNRLCESANTTVFSAALADQLRRRHLPYIAAHAAVWDRLKPLADAAAEAEGVPAPTEYTAMFLS